MEKEDVTNVFENKNQTINEKYEQLKNCSSNELMQKLVKEVQVQKMNGTFDFQGLKNSVEAMKTYLPLQTYENMIRIIDNLK